jgi:hypothetical protein
VTWGEGREGDTPQGPWKLCPNCSAQTQTFGHICPYCGASYYQQGPPPRQPAGGVVVFRKRIPTWVAVTLICGVSLLAVLWASGGLDPQLAQFGLNREPCIKNYLTGAVVCGDEARDFCHRLETGEFQVHPDACKGIE